MGTIKKIGLIRAIYLYLVTAISIVLVLISTIGLIRLALNEYVFDVKGFEEIDGYWECGETGLSREITKPLIVGEATVAEEIFTEEEKAKCIAEADERRELQHINDLKRDLVNWLSMFIVAVPLYLYHWGVIKKEGKK